MTALAARHISNIHPVDRLGEIRADIADLKEIEAPLAAEIKALGAGTYAGDLFVGRVSEIPGSKKYDVDALEQKLRALGVDDRFFAKHIIETRKASIRLTLKDRK